MFGSRSGPVVLGVLALILLPGCPANLNRVPGSTETIKDPKTEGSYLVYVPSWHSNEQRWPVVVTCHGTIPWDTADLQLREWRGLAERVGFIVLAPRLKGTNGTGLVGREDQLRRQREDEALIISAVDQALKNLNGDSDRVYMTGWSGGGLAVYHTGLNNPSVFRALAVRMGNFDETFLPNIRERLDPYQPVAIFFAASDPLLGINIQSRKAADFLETMGGKRVFPREIAGGHRRKPEIAFDFFKTVTEKYSLVRPRAVTGIGENGLGVQFYLQVDPPPQAVFWDFGDGQTAAEPTPRHYYAVPGRYSAKVTVVTARGAKTHRELHLDLSR
ncbi:MAG: PKD domain-containing protein [Phycisphaerae bacterium]|nr:PKD domain-containing protein [Phycisphaerae bacterium]